MYVLICLSDLNAYATEGAGHIDLVSAPANTAGGMANIPLDSVASVIGSVISSIYTSSISTFKAGYDVGASSAKHRDDSLRVSK